MGVRMAKGDIKMASLKGITVRITFTRSLTVRMWIAIQLHKLAARIAGMDVKVEAS